MSTNLRVEVSADVDRLTGTTTVTMQETTCEPGVSMRLTFDTMNVDAEYLEACITGFPEVAVQYFADVAEAKSV